MDPALARLLGTLAAELGASREPWWLIGSAAMAVHGAQVEVRDVDLLLGRSDAEAFLVRRGMAAEPGMPSEFFSSAVFSAWAQPPYTVELFAGFRVRQGEDWRTLEPETRELHRIGHASLFVPSVAELIAWGHVFDRPKDREREPLLRALLPPAR